MSIDYSDFRKCECCEHLTADFWRCDDCNSILCFGCEQPKSGRCSYCHDDAVVEARIEAKGEN